jgi:hypothetical protein
MSKRALPVLTTAEPKKKTMLPEVLPDPRARRQGAGESPRARTLERLKGLRAAAASDAPAGPVAEQAAEPDARSGRAEPEAPAAISSTEPARP